MESPSHIDFEKSGFGELEQLVPVVECGFGDAEGNGTFSPFEFLPVGNARIMRRLAAIRTPPVTRQRAKGGVRGCLGEVGAEWGHRLREQAVEDGGSSRARAAMGRNPDVLHLIDVLSGKHPASDARLGAMTMTRTW